MSTHTRCRKCDARKALARWPTEATCGCGGTYRIDKWANSKPWRKKMCRCNGVAKWSGSSFADSPHRLGSPGCVGHVEPLPPSEYDPEFGF